MNPSFMSDQVCAVSDSSCLSVAFSQTFSVGEINLKVFSWWSISLCVRCVQGFCLEVFFPRSHRVTRRSGTLWQSCRSTCQTLFLPVWQLDRRRVLIDSEWRTQRLQSKVHLLEYFTEVLITDFTHENTTPLKTWIMSISRLSKTMQNVACSLDQTWRRPQDVTEWSEQLIISNFIWASLLLHHLKFLLQSDFTVDQTESEFIDNPIFVDRFESGH